MSATRVYENMDFRNGISMDLPFISICPEKKTDQKIKEPGRLPDEFPVMVDIT
jgi:hypothetical protein